MNHQTIKDLPLSERPYEKCEKYGTNSLSDAELLAVILKSGTREESSVELARRILALPRRKPGLSGLYTLRIQDLKRIPGIGNVKAIQILCTLELARRLSVASVPKPKQFTLPGEIAAYYFPKIGYESVEHFLAAFLDTKCHLICDEILFKGSISSCPANPRELFSKALLCDASYVIVLHNHPSGDPAPSEEDLWITKKLHAAGNLLGIPLLDHIVIGDHRYISFKEEGYLPEK